MLMQAESVRAMNQTECYLYNAFSLISRMHRDWIDWKVYMEEPLCWSQVAVMENHKAEMPSKSDLEDSCQ